MRAARRRRPCRETALTQECVDVRIAAAEAAISFRAIRAVGFAKNDVAHACGDGRVENVAGLVEHFRRVRGHHFRPEIGIIAGGIGVAREEMPELRQTMACGHAPDCLRMSYESRTTRW